jgi:hypothetical protein
LFGGEYRNRTGLHGFAIQKEVKRKQRFRVSKYPLTNREQNAKVSNSLSPFQNKKGNCPACCVEEYC